MTEPLGVRARALVRAYGKTHALDGVDIDAEPGSIVAVTGSNGAGKTTLLRILATLLRPDGGEAWVNGGHLVRDADQVRRSIGVALVNDRGVYWRLSGKANLEFFARTLGMSKNEAAQAAARATSQLAIEPFAERAVSGYSAGQRQRLVLARAILGDPPVLLVDEPMRGLDEDGITRVRTLLRGHRERGGTVVVAGPTIAEFSDLCDVVYRLEHGKVLERVERATEAVGER